VPQRKFNAHANFFVGALIGFVPSIIGILSNVIAPQVVLPGQKFYFLSFVAIPIAWSMAVLKGAAD
jgi:hypothetical protein